MRNLVPGLGHFSFLDNIFQARFDLRIHIINQTLSLPYLQEKPKLYTYFRSSCSWRVRIALNITGLEVDMEPVHLVNGVQHSEEYRRVNPMGQVPALVIDDMTLTQSVAIMEYLHDTNPEAGLLPASPKERAKVRMISEVIASGTQPIQVRAFFTCDQLDVVIFSEPGSDAPPLL